MRLTEAAAAAAAAAIASQQQLTPLLPPDCVGVGMAAGETVQDLLKKSAALNATQWTLGNDRRDWSTNTSEAFAAREAPRVFRHDKNRQVAQQLKLESGGDLAPAQRYMSATAATHCGSTSVLSAAYARSAPAPGFDRLTANRHTKLTDAAGGGSAGYSTSNADATKHPRTQPQPPALHFKAREDWPGIGFNPVDGRDGWNANAARPVPVAIACSDVDQYQGLLGFRATGDREYDLLKGRTRPKYQAPPPVEPPARRFPAPIVGHISKVPVEKRPAHLRGDYPIAASPAAHAAGATGGVARQAHR